MVVSHPNSLRLKIGLRNFEPAKGKLRTMDHSWYNKFEIQTTRLCRSTMVVGEVEKIATK